MATQPSQPEPARRVILWGVPMSLSTVFTRCISAGGDAEIFVEPYDNCHSFGPERRRAAWPPSLANGERRLVNDWQTYARAKTELEAAASDPTPGTGAGAGLVFVKDMAFAVAGKYETLPDGYRHTFLVRDPSKVWSAYRRRILQLLATASRSGVEGAAADGEGKAAPPQSVMGDLESYVSPTPVFRASFELMEHARTVLHQEPVVVDADDFAERPAATLRSYCSALGLQYRDTMLSMESESTKWHCSEFFSWGAKHGGFYAKAMQSTEIRRPARDGPRLADEPLPPEVAECVARSQEWYDRMYALRLKPE